LPCPPAKVYESPFREVEVRDRDLVEIDGLDPERHYAVLAEVEGFARVWLFGLLPRALAYEVELEEEGRLEGVVHGDGARLEGATLTLREDDGDASVWRLGASENDCPWELDPTLRTERSFEDGRYAIGQLSAGKHRLLATAEGFVPEEVEVTIAP